MPPLKLSRSVTINAPKEKIANIINDFHTWPSWSPWLITDPDATVDVEPDGKSYTWEGKRVGSGAMKIDKEEGTDAIYCDLQFLKPWKSKAKTKFHLTAEGDSTKVEWHMDSSLPFFLFFMQKSMEAFIANDYQRGLNLLKDLAEDGEVHSKLDWVGEQQFQGTKFVGIERSCALDEMGPVMAEDFKKLGTYVEDMKDIDPTKVFCQYHKFDMVKNKAKYTVGMPVSEVPASLEKGFIQGTLPSTKIYTLKHTGPYTHLGNAWNTMYGMARSKEIRAKKSMHPFETYGNNPENTDPNDLITYVNFAIR